MRTESDRYDSFIEPYIPIDGQRKINPSKSPTMPDQFITHLPTHYSTSDPSIHQSFTLKKPPKLLLKIINSTNSSPQTPPPSTPATRPWEENSPYIPCRAQSPSSKHPCHQIYPPRAFQTFQAFQEIREAVRSAHAAVYATQ